MVACMHMHVTCGKGGKVECNLWTVSFSYCPFCKACLPLGLASWPPGDAQIPNIWVFPGSSLPSFSPALLWLSLEQPCHTPFLLFSHQAGTCLAWAPVPMTAARENKTNKKGWAWMLGREWVRSKAEVGGKEVDETGPHGHHPGAMAVTSQALGTESSLSGHFSEERGIFPPRRFPQRQLLIGQEVPGCPEAAHMHSDPCQRDLWKWRNRRPLPFSVYGSLGWGTGTPTLLPAPCPCHLSWCPVLSFAMA